MLLVIIAVLYNSTATPTQDSACNACNCQLNNIHVLKELMKAEITSALANDTSEQTCAAQ